MVRYNNTTINPEIALKKTKEEYMEMFIKHPMFEGLTKKEKEKEINKIYDDSFVLLGVKKETKPVDNTTGVDEVEYKTSKKKSKKSKDSE